MVKWHHDKSGNSPDLKGLKNIIMTRCIGGKRHSLIIKKVIEDLHKLKCNGPSHSGNKDDNNSNSISAKIKTILNTTCNFSTKSDDTNDGIFRFQSCQVETCEHCNMSCVNCKVKYKYWDEFWIKCGWCKGRDFCGKCVLEASKKNTMKNHTFQFMRIKLCQMFDLPCPF